jgi:predicted transcriptional regulator of viral defense system
LTRLTRGVYALPNLVEPLAVAAQLRGVVSHESAARLRGVKLIDEPATLHVTVPHTAHPTPLPGVTLHRTRTFTGEDVDQGITTPLRTVLDCAASMPFREALAIADSALAQSLIREQDHLIAAADRTRGPGRAKRLRVARSADRRADNPFESALRAILLDARIDGFEPQL